MNKYKIIEVKEDEKDSVIEKTGITIKITLGDMERQLTRVKKIEEELKAQKLVNDAQITNCENNYEGIADVTEEEEKRAIAITLRKGNLKENAVIEAKLNEITEAIADYDKEVAEIKEVLDGHKYEQEETTNE